MILVPILSQDNVLSDYINIYATFPNFKVTKIEHSAFLGHPVYICWWSWTIRHCFHEVRALRENGDKFILML